jgi:hypothetical protein
MKIGNHEFEADGEEETVQRGFAAWQDMVARAPVVSASVSVGTNTVVRGEADDTGTAGLIFDHQGWDRIIRREGKEGRELYLTVLPAGADRTADAVLVLMLAHKVFNHLDSVGGSPLLRGLHRSGYRPQRVDRMVEPYMQTLVLRGGTRRGVRYRLSTAGVNKAMIVARELMDSVP